MESIKFIRGQEDVVVVEEKDYAQSIFKEQYVNALHQLDLLAEKPKDKIPSIVAFCGDRGEGKTSCMETVIHMLANCKKRSISTHPKRGYPFTFLTSSS